MAMKWEATREMLRTMEAVFSDDSDPKEATRMKLLAEELTTQFAKSQSDIRHTIRGGRGS